jgi:aminomethyltransferase
VGRAALEPLAGEGGCAERMINFEVTGRGVARHGYPIATTDGATVGEVTSGSFSPSLDKNIGVGWVRGDLAAPGTALTVLVRNQPVGIRVLKRPMYKRAR